MDSYEGDATIAAYTVAHGRDGEPASALAIVDLPPGASDDGAARAYSRLEDPADLAELEATECVGRTVHLTPDGQVNRAEF